MPYQYVKEIRLCEDVSGTSQSPFCPFSTEIKQDKINASTHLKLG